MVEQVYINKEEGEMQHKVWKRGRRKKTIEKKQQNYKACGQLQTKVWDPRGFHLHMKAHG